MDVLKGKVGVIGKNVLDGIAGGETAEDMLDRDPGAGDDRLSHHDLGVAPDAWMAHVLGSMDGKDSTIRAGGRGRDQVVVLPTRLSDVGQVMRKVSAHLGRGNQGTTQALVDEKLDGQCGIRAAGMLRQSGPYVSCAHRITASIPSTGKLG